MVFPFCLEQKKMMFHFVFSCLDYLLDSGGNPTVKNAKGYSAVHYAAAYGNKQHLEMVSATFLTSELTLAVFFSIAWVVKSCCFFYFQAPGDFFQLS